MTFKPGQSGNPAGRPPAKLAPKELKALAREHTEEAVRRLAFWMRQTKSPTAAVQAALALLDRGWGKPQASLEMTGKDGQPVVETPKLSDMEAARAIAFALSRGLQEAPEGILNEARAEQADRLIQ